MRRTTGLCVAYGLKQGLVLVRSERGTIYLITAASAKEGIVFELSSPMRRKRTRSGSVTTSPSRSCRCLCGPHTETRPPRASMFEDMVRHFCVTDFAIGCH